MSIYARTLSVTEYRSFPSFELDLARGVTVLVGYNAVGKTNLVEALQLLTSGRSFRKPSPRELVRAGGTRCSMKLTLEGEGRALIRASGTEPLVRVMVEAPTIELCEQYVNKVVEVIESL